MREVILQMGVSLDGYVAGPDRDNGDWGLPPEDEALRHVMFPEDLVDPESRVEFWRTHSDPVQETLVSLLPEDEQVRHVFIMQRDVLPRRKTGLAEIQQTSYGPFHARGEIL